MKKIYRITVIAKTIVEEKDRKKRETPVPYKKVDIILYKEFETKKEALDYAKLLRKNVTKNMNTFIDIRETLLSGFEVEEVKKKEKDSIFATMGEASGAQWIELNNAELIDSMAYAITSTEKGTFKPKGNFSFSKVPL